MSDRYSVTPKEIELLEEKMQGLAPGYRMFDRQKMEPAVMAAASQFGNDSTLFDHTKKMSRARLMRRVLTDPKREGYGVPFQWWYCDFDYRLFLGLKQDPWNEVKWWIYEMLRGQRQNCVYWGCANAGKTQWMGRFGGVSMALWLQHCRIYVTGPYKLAADDKVWGDAIKPSLERIKKPGNPFADSLMLRVEINEEDAAVYDIVTGESATAKFVSLESASSVQGKKAIEHEGEGLIGVTALLMDEFIENPGAKLKQAESNMSSNHNYIGFLACNPLPAKVQHISMREFSYPVELDTSHMRKEMNFSWETKYGKVFRFSWQNCPNNILGRTVWPYMVNEGMASTTRKKDADLVAAQLDAWGFSSSGISFLDEPTVRAAGSYLVPVWRTSRTRFMAVDCAFGGSDPATYTILEAGTSAVPNERNVSIERQVFSGVAQEVMPVGGDFAFSSDWMKHMRNLHDYTGGDFPDSISIAPFSEGQLIPASYHLAQLVMEAAIEYRVPPGNITFDSSQRGDCTTILLASLGRRNVKYYYEGTRSLDVEEELTPDWFLWPFEYEGQDDKGKQRAKKWSDLCSNPISMIWMFACNFIRHGGLVNAESMKDGIAELIARPIETSKSGKSFRRDVMSKRAMKDAGVKSPTWGEGLSLAIYFGVRFLGLWPLGRPELSTVISATSPTMGEIIRAGPSRRFGFSGRSWMNER